MGAITKAVLILGALGAISFLSAMAYSDDITQEAIEKETRPLRVMQAQLAFPLQWDAIVCTDKCRYYSRKSK